MIEKILLELTSKNKSAFFYNGSFHHNPSVFISEIIENANKKKKKERNDQKYTHVHLEYPYVKPAENR